MLRSETAGDPARTAAAIAGLRAYQDAPRPQRAPPMSAIARAGRVVLRDHGGTGRPVVFIPSLINPPAILDLGEQSLLRWMAMQGVNPLLVDWGTPGESDRDLDVATHVETLLVPLIESLDEPPVLVGYCLGGTMAIAAAMLTRVAGLATLAAPWCFAGYGEARDGMAAMWTAAQATCAALGVVPMEMLQAGFWRLDPARTVRKYEAFGRMDPESRAAGAFVRLEDWANAGAPLPYAVGRDLFERFIRDDAPGERRWRAGRRIVDPAALRCPTLQFVSQTDRIVPAATAASLGERRDLAIGHVGMIVGSRARDQVWRPLAEWITALPPAISRRA